MPYPYLLKEDDPIVNCMMKTGLPPWQVYKDWGYDEDEDDEEGLGDEDVYYGNETSSF